METKLRQTEEIIDLWNDCHLDMSKGTITISTSALKETIHLVGISIVIPMLYMLVKPKEILKKELEILEPKNLWYNDERNNLRLSCGLDLFVKDLDLSKRQTETGRVGFDIDRRGLVLRWLKTIFRANSKLIKVFISACLFYCMYIAFSR